MSPNAIAHLQRIARRTRVYVMTENHDLAAKVAQGFPPIRIYTVRDYYRPLDIVRILGPNA